MRAIATSRCAVVGERDFPGADGGAAAKQPGRARAVMGSAEGRSRAHAGGLRCEPRCVENAERFETFGLVERRQQARESPSEQRLAGARRACEQ